MKCVALLFTVLWSAQAPLCLLAMPDMGHHTGSHGGASHHAPHAVRGAAAPEAPDPTEDDSRSGCAEHCASLARSIAGAPPALDAAPDLTFAAFSACALVLHSEFAPAAGDARERQPPDPVLRATILRL
jgi:hypothetical protein